MKQSLPVIGMFVSGCFVGAWLQPDGSLQDASIYILYALMFQVGLGLGASDALRSVLRTFRPKMLLLPLGTLCGTLACSALVGLLLTKWSVIDTMTLGAGMGYYSLSSVLIMQLKMPTVGEQLAAELGTIALLANICRELLTLFCAPWLRRWWGPYAPICAAGVTSVDVSLPIIGRVSGAEFIPVAMFHGMVLDMTVPLLLPLLCQWQG